MAILFLGYLHHYRKTTYYYKTDKDYQYDFSDSNAQVLIPEYRGNTLVIPESFDIENHSLFLKVILKPSFLGNFLKPSVTVSCNNAHSVNQFEIGAKGSRYINLSGLNSAGCKQIELLPQYTNLDFKGSQLYAFKDEKIEDKRILVVGTHPDDAEIAAYGLYANHKDTFVLTITSGEAGPFVYDEIYADTVEHYLEKGKLRTWNSVTVPLLAGVEPDNILNLGFFDETLQSMYTNDTAKVMGIFTKTNDINTFRKFNTSKYKDSLTGSSNWNSLVSNLKYLIGAFKPDIIVAPYPLIDLHPDHKFTTIAVIEALKGLDMHDGFLFLYTNHHTLSESYPYGDTGEEVTLPPYFKNGLYFNSIFSNRVDEAILKEKILAFDAMNDLRGDTEWRFPQKEVSNFSRNMVMQTMGITKDYYRRAARSNELFFIVDIKNIYNSEVYKKITAGAFDNVPAVMSEISY